MKCRGAGRRGEARFAPFFVSQADLRRPDLQVLAEDDPQEGPPRHEVLPVALEMELGRARPFVVREHGQGGRVFSVGALQQGAPDMDRAARQLHLRRRRRPA